MLEKYHKQKQSKKFRKKYEPINQTFNLKYDTKNEIDLLYLSSFVTALNQKRVIENTYESVRNECFDMWDSLMFYERNKLIHNSLFPVLEDLLSFDFEGTPIYIPFFDRLLNSLYVKEIAILEKPQFFDLYRSFKDRLIPLETYGLDVLRAGFSYLPVISSNDDFLVFYENSINVFYLVSEKQSKRYPISTKVTLDDSQIKTLSDALLVSEDTFIDILIENKWIKPRCIKKILKARKKHEAK